MKFKFHIINNKHIGELLSCADTSYSIIILTYYTDTPSLQVS